MEFFFVKDYRDKPRFFSSDPPKLVQVKFSGHKKIWELAKKKLMLLPQRLLRQEQAFEKGLKLRESSMRIFVSGRTDEKKTKLKFYFFLQRQRTKHIVLLIGETILLPISGLAALLPGPNVFFGALALIMITHWQALRGITRIVGKRHEFAISSLLSQWEEAVENKNYDHFTPILNKITEKYQIENIQKILWKP